MAAGFPQIVTVARELRPDRIRSASPPLGASPNQVQNRRAREAIYDKFNASGGTFKVCKSGK